MAPLRSTRQISPDKPFSDSPETPTSRGRRVLLRVVVLGICAAVAAGTVMEVRHTSTASADPSAQDWYRLRVCESSDNYRTNTGNGHYGAYQFDLPTWRSVGGSGYPYQASPAEQDARALMLYRERGWQPWQCAGIVGLREDNDARSGRISGISVPRSAPHASNSHAWPGVYYTVGDHSAGIRQWQLRMRARGAPLTGTGQFGAHTLAVVKAIQSQNGLRATGLLGPNTWALAWSGKYRKNAPSKPAPRPVAHAKAPRWPGTQYYSIGDHSSTIRTWQLRMRARGVPLTGTGQFGPHTLAVVKRIQRMNHLRVTGILGPVTWKLAWTGRY